MKTDIDIHTTTAHLSGHVRVADAEHQWLRLEITGDGSGWPRGFLSLFSDVGGLTVSQELVDALRAMVPK